MQNVPCKFVVQILVCIGGVNMIEIKEYIGYFDVKKAPKVNKNAKKSSVNKSKSTKSKAKGK